MQSRRSMAPTLPAWKTCSTFMPRRRIRRGPVVRFDESPTQLIGEVRQPTAPEPGTLSAMIMNIAVTARSTCSSSSTSACATWSIPLSPGQADPRRARQSVDPFAGRLVRRLPAPEAHRLLRRLEFHHTPSTPAGSTWSKSKSGVLRGQCLDRRIGRAPAAGRRNRRWEHQRNDTGARVKWSSPPSAPEQK